MLLSLITTKNNPLDRNSQGNVAVSQLDFVKSDVTEISSCHISFTQITNRTRYACIDKSGLVQEQDEISFRPAHAHLQREALNRLHKPAKRNTVSFLACPKQFLSDHESHLLSFRTSFSFPTWLNVVHFVGGPNRP